MTTEHDAPRDGHTPDFADLYEDSFSKGGAITPRMAYWLWVSCLYFSDAWRDARDEPALLHDYFPPLARPLAHGPWLDRFIDCFDRLADGIVTGTADSEHSPAARARSSLSTSRLTMRRPTSRTATRGRHRRRSHAA